MNFSQSIYFFNFFLEPISVVANVATKGLDVSGETSWLESEKYRFSSQGSGGIDQDSVSKLWRNIEGIYVKSVLLSKFCDPGYLSKMASLHSELADPIAKANGVFIQKFDLFFKDLMKCYWPCFSKNNLGYKSTEGPVVAELDQISNFTKEINQENSNILVDLSNVWGSNSTTVCS